MTDVIAGRCFCGGVKFQVQPPLKMFSHCHCESCRRSHGAAFVSWTSVDEAAFKTLSGLELVKSYQSSPGIDWQFCGTCGSPLFQTTRHSPGVIYVVAAALDLPASYQAEAHVSFGEKVSWLDVKDHLPKYQNKTSDIIATDPSTSD